MVTRRPQFADRHGSTASSGAESWTSQDTVKGVFAPRRGTPMRVATADKDARLDRDVEISPGSAPYSSRPPMPSSIAPWEIQRPPDMDNYRRELGVLDGPGGKLPSVNRQPQSGLVNPQWQSSPPVAGNGNPNTKHGNARPPSIYGSFYDDSSEDVNQFSPSFRPGSSQEDMGFPGEDRRPSIASATTVSSIGSKSSVGRGFHKKLTGFFGDEFPGLEVSRQNSESSLPPHAMYAPGINPNAPPAGAASMSALNPQVSASSPIEPRAAARNRNNSMNTMHTLSRPASPSSFTRPRTPHTSEVTPWEFQDIKDNPLPPPPPEKPGSKSSKTHKLLPGHRHTRSKEDGSPAELPPGAALRPVPSREESSLSIRRNGYTPYAGPSASSKTALVPRPSSPTPSTHSANAMPKSPHVPTNKRGGILDKLRHRRDKPDRLGIETLQNLPASSVSLQQAKIVKPQKSDITVPPGKKRSTGGEGVVLPSKAPINPKDAGRRRPFTSKRTELPQRDPNEVNPTSSESNALWALDTDLSNMDDIINTRPQMTPPAAGEIWTGYDDGPKIDQRLNDAGQGTWDAPDSWVVNKPGDANMERLREFNENDTPLEDETGPPYCLRIFRSDSTFAVLSVPLNTTVADIVSLIRKKSFLTNELDNYLIVMRKHEVSRQLRSNERPLVIQKRLLEQAGYTDTDKIEDVGREDNSYLCRFTFLPQKSSGYASLEKDPELDKLAKFTHVDLQGKNLVTIPVALHKRATEIISLNLSRNLSLDVPKDFIQACTNLREIKFTGNEVYQLPSSFNQANRLTMLDVSNNSLEQLEHAELHKLQNLSSLRLSNNRLTALPSYFSQYECLRSLNLSSNSLVEFPQALCELSTLSDLDISFNSISHLPDLEGLASLERLWATNNKFSGSFPPSTGNCYNLREIDIRFNAIDDIDVVSTLPRLEFLDMGHNSISSFDGTFAKIRQLKLDHNPVTRFSLSAPVPSLASLHIEKAVLASLPDDLFQRIPNLTKLCLDKNHFVSLSPHIGKLSKLEHLSIAQNALRNLPQEIGRLTELRYLDLRENNLSSLPAQIWFARRLETLNVSSNCLASFPKPGAPMLAPLDQPYDNISQNTIPEDELRNFDSYSSSTRRPSQVSSQLSAGSVSPVQSRKGSLASVYGSRKPSMVSRGSDTTLTPISRKDSSMSNRLVITFAGSLRHLYMAENRLEDEVFDELALLPELRVLNLSYNELYDLPSRTCKRWTHLDELYLSGNNLSSLPSEDLEEVSSLRVLHVNGNKIQVLPAELAKIQKLAIMDVGCNLLKYNVSNWPYDWNWNWNPQLKYLNLSGNRRLEIKPGGSYTLGTRVEKDLTDFSSLSKLRVLGLMDVTLRSSVPDQSEDRRVRTAGSTVGGMPYGMADTMGRDEHISTMDMVIDRFRSHEDETIVGMFDGQVLTEGGSRLAKYLYDNFKHRFADELDKLRDEENPVDALRRTYLSLNKDIAIAVMAAQEQKQGVAANGHRPSVAQPDLGEQDLQSGCVAAVLFLKDTELFVSNVGDCTVLLMDTSGEHKVLTRKHDPAEPSERQRIRAAGGFVSRGGKLNDKLEISRAFGYIQLSPAIIAAPHVAQITITDSHEMILIASRELWRYMSREFAVELARTERGDPMRAAQKVRDMAIAFGASTKIMVMILDVRDLRRKERLQIRTHSMSMSPSGYVEDIFPQVRRGRRARDAVADSRLARLDQEIDAPTQHLSLVFTDIKNSTLLWETYPAPMRSAIKMHNDLMRRQLRNIGGYEVKTEGDAFMVAFPTVTSALLWCFTVQIQLLELSWPNEILNSVHGQEVCDGDANVIFRGLSVRMGIHWGTAWCEVDPVTKRMDYFGPMVNRASRIESVADGGQITVSADFIAEIQRLLETYMETDRNGSTGSEEALNEDLMAQNIRRELRSLSSQGFEVKDLGEVKLKGLENPEYIYLMMPHALSSRLLVQAPPEPKATTASTIPEFDGQLTINPTDVWELYSVSLRLELICSSLEGDGSDRHLKAPETAFLERIRGGGGEITDRFLLAMVEHLVSRLETCITTLTLRNLMRPFKNGLMQSACPMASILDDLTGQLAELATLKQQLTN